MYASGANVALTVTLHDRARRVRRPGRARPAARQLRRLGGRRARPVVGAAPALLAARAGSPTCARCSRFGLPTVPADASVYALQVADRFYLFRAYSHAAAGLYAVAIKLATVVFVAVRGFQYAWPPLAYSIESDEEAARLYSLVTTYYVLATGVVVCGVALLGRWMVRLLAAPAVLRRLPRAAVAGARLGAVRAVPGVRRRSPAARASPRATSPPRPSGLAVNVALLLVLVPDERRGPRHRRRRASRCAAPTWRCSPSCTCSPAACSASASNGGAWRSSRRSSAASPSPASCCCRPAALARPRCARSRGSRWSRALLLATRFFHPHERAQARRARGGRPPARGGVPRRHGERRGLRRGPAARHLSGLALRLYALGRLAQALAARRAQASRVTWRQ